MISSNSKGNDCHSVGIMSAVTNHHCIGIRNRVPVFPSKTTGKYPAPFIEHPSVAAAHKNRPIPLKNNPLIKTKHAQAKCISI